MQSSGAAEWGETLDNAAYSAATPSLASLTPRPRSADEPARDSRENGEEQTQGGEQEGSEEGEGGEGKEGGEGGGGGREVIPAHTTAVLSVPVVVAAVVYAVAVAWGVAVFPPKENTLMAFAKTMPVCVVFVGGVRER